MKKQSNKETVDLFLILGWITSVIGLFVPAVAIAGIILGSLTVKRQHLVAGIILIIFACIALYLGLTGFRESFIEGFHQGITNSRTK
ncbi:hypothetical protein AZI11_04130 [Levilactobacillus brevis]|uniref:hypothetical protein n=1 Tax=Levilactobacillus brevis TaxID=1580 RepID=UPI000A2071A3|nr:hypothetical protein [Levilactobacillus brevis]ARN92153.1 hypothetical protein AZI11_04130 [Levilactobacillus brevis]ARN94846.1 hypothetical protein AZI12_04150 [Levilactobacillus brevis]